MTNILIRRQSSLLLEGDLLEDEARRPMFLSLNKAAEVLIANRNVSVTLSTSIPRWEAISFLRIILD